ncbi:MAG: tRNA uridine-5-carboxymethylaminomethyl(34) synthesis GTPase MnmE [Candidatus Endonucleobacter sp. (ex Gigantidas childressi)]|nr:tRNA uridine-5-carboxymethylaminomethyl(34) synthesis GTPase MnmE [Candidatus Endonucleobacter sp. (ex Gigantidas childressi)]
MKNDFSITQKDTIAAQATASGRGGVGIIRVSGPNTQNVIINVLQISLQPRYAHYGAFYDAVGNIIDVGISLYFPAPHSFTGEDILELHGHGGPIVMDMLLKRVLSTGVRHAKPGEFSERAFLNNKMDLTQVEAVADLIDSTSVQAAKSAMKSLKGVFSKKVNLLVEELIRLRTYVESSIDFPEEEIDFLADGKVLGDLSILIERLDDVVKEVAQGVVLKEGMTVVIAGRPNAGKSSLLNSLTRRETAIVTDIAGTTRDVLREHIHIDGIPLHVIDTAGLRYTENKVEQIGVERAIKEINEADLVLLIIDGETIKSTDPYEIWPDFIDHLPHPSKLVVVRNKVDLTSERLGQTLENGVPVFRISAINGGGLDELKHYLKKCMGFENTIEGGFSARRRHLDALSFARETLVNGKMQLEYMGAGEMLAEDLFHAQKYLGEITGDFTSNDLLGRIFSTFCIGK